MRHIFHTNNEGIRDFVNGIVPFNRFTNCPVANYLGRLFNLPFNRNTFYQMWGYTKIGKCDGNQIYLKYKSLADQEEHVVFGGRLAEYKYYDQDLVMKRALKFYNG